METTSPVMPKLPKGSALSRLSGKLGGLVFRELYGETIVQVKPGKRKTLTAHQKASSEKFTAASRWAKRIANDPRLRTPYVAKVSGAIANPYTVAMRDHLNPPKVVAIFTHNYTGQPGSKIVVEAVDDFMVESVTVKILDNHRGVIEAGQAKNINGNNMWYYVATVTNENLSDTKIIATALDNPGHEATLELKL